MNISRSSIAVEIAPSTIRIAKLVRRNRQLSITAIAEMPLPYDSFETLYSHQEECTRALNELCQQVGIRSGSCVVALPAARAKTQTVVLPLMKSAALHRVLSNPNFWRKHLGLDSGAYRYAWLVTVRDTVQHRLSLWLMAAPLKDICFYKNVLAGTRLSLQVLTLSSLDYFCVAYHREAAFSMVRITSHESSLIYFAKDNFCHRTLLSEEESRLVLSDKTPEPRLALVLAKLAKVIKEATRVAHPTAGAIQVAMVCDQSLATQRIAQLQALLADISLQPFDIYKELTVAAHLARPTHDANHVVALAHWLMSDALGARRDCANFIYSHARVYYWVAICWGLTIVIALSLMAAYQQLEQRRDMLEPQIQYQKQLAAQHATASRELASLQQQIVARRNLLDTLNVFSHQQQFTVDFLTHLRHSLTRTIYIESLDCQWQDTCSIKGRANTYKEIIFFADALKKIEGVGAVVVHKTQSEPDHPSTAIGFVLECAFNGGQPNDG